MFIPYRDENPSQNFPIVTLLLIGINTAIFFVSTISGGIDVFAGRWGFTTVHILDRPQIMVTSLILHANFIHLLSNMWFLWLFGDNIEDRFGRMQFLILFILSGIVGNFTHALFNFFQSDVPVVGASGAVAGIMGSYLMRFPRAKIRCMFILIFFPFFFRLSSFWFIGAWLLGEFLAAYASPGGHVAHWAHIGGFAFGFIWAYGRKDKKPFPRGAWGIR